MPKPTPRQIRLASFLIVVVGSAIVFQNCSSPGTSAQSSLKSTPEAGPRSGVEVPSAVVPQTPAPHGGDASASESSVGPVVNAPAAESGGTAVVEAPATGYFASGGFWLGTNLSPVSLGRYLKPDPGNLCQGQVGPDRYNASCLHADGQFLITDLHRGENRATAVKGIQSMAGASRNTLSLVLHYMDWDIKTTPSNSWDGWVRAVPQGLAGTMDHEHYLTNLIDVARMAKAAGMKQLILRFASGGAINSPDWHPAGNKYECAWDEARFQLSWNFISNTIKQIETQRSQYAPLEIYYDAALEPGGSPVGCSRSFVKGLLMNLTHLKYADPTSSNAYRDVKLLGSSMAYNANYISTYFSDLDQINYHEPYVAAVDFYDTYEGGIKSSDVLSMIDLFVADFTASRVNHPSSKLLVLETYYNDSQVAIRTAEKTAVFGQDMLGYLEWPNDRPTFTKWMETNPAQGNSYSSEFANGFAGLNAFARTMAFSKIEVAGSGCPDLGCLYIQSKRAGPDVCIKLLTKGFGEVGSTYCGAQVIHQSNTPGTVYTVRLTAADAAYKRAHGVYVLIYSQSAPHLYSDPYPDLLR